MTITTTTNQNSSKAQNKVDTSREAVESLADHLECCYVRDVAQDQQAADMLRALLAERDALRELCGKLVKAYGECAAHGADWNALAQW